MTTQQIPTDPAYQAELEQLLSLFPTTNETREGLSNLIRWHLFLRRLMLSQGKFFIPRTPVTYGSLQYILVRDWELSRGRVRWMVVMVVGLFGR